ncbi:MAG: ABC transporter substrate-binding protein [bacterium]
MKQLIPVLVLACSACSQGATSSMKFGAAGPWKTEFGTMNKRGIELAVAEINALPERQQRPLVVRYEDDDASGEKASRIAQSFVDSSDVLGVIGHVNSSPAVAAARIYDGHLAAVATSATSPELTGISKWTFRVSASDSTTGADMARFAMRRGRKRAAILYQNDTYGRGLVNAFRKAFTGTVVSVDPINNAADQPFEPYVSFYKQQKPDVIFTAASDVAGRAFLREVRRQQLDAELLGDGWSGLSSDPLAEGAFTGVPFTLESPRAEVQAFVRAFKQKFGVVPYLNAALAYDATKLMYQAAVHGADRKQIRDYLSALDQASAYQGVTGPIYFRPDGDPVGKTLVMTRFERGALRVVEEAK